VAGLLAIAQLVDAEEKQALADALACLRRWKLFRELRLRLFPFLFEPFHMLEFASENGLQTAK